MAGTSNNIYTQLDPGTQTFFGSPLSFTIGQTPAAGQPGSLLQISSFLLLMFLVAASGAGIIRILYALALRVGTFGEPSETGYANSKKIINTVLVTLLLMFSAVLLMLAVNPDVVTGDVNLGALKVTGTAAQSQTATQNPPAQTGAGSATYTARVASHNAVVATLSAANIHTNHGDAPCTEAQFSERTPSCTSLAYLHQDTVNMLLRLKQYCNCSIVISGGTEPGHASHGEGLRPVDLQISGSQNTNDPLYRWVNVAGTPLGPSGNCFAQFSLYGFTFCDEKPRTNSTWGPHFHVG